MNTSLVLVAVAALLGLAGVWLIPVRRRALGWAVAVLLVITAGTIPAVATFSTNPAGHPHPAPATPFNTASLPTISLTTPACTYTGNTALRVDWTALTSPYSWVDSVQPYKSTNGGAYSTLGSSLAYNSPTVSDSGLTPSSNTYTYKIQAKQGSNWATDSSTASSATCAGRISSAFTPTTTTSQIHTNEGVFVDASGNVYIADTGGNRVDFIPAAAGTYYGALRSAGFLYTIAGQGGAGNTGDTGVATSAKFNNPSQLTADSSGNIYVADTSNHRIRIIINTSCVTCPFGYSNLTGGNIYNFAGSTGGSGNTGDGQLLNNAAVKFSAPQGIAFDSGGNLIISDSGNNRLRMITADTSNHYGVTMGAANTVYNIAGSSAAASGSSDNFPATSGTFTTPAQVALDSSNNIYIADTGNVTIRKVSAVSTFGLTKIAGTTGASGAAAGDGGSAINAAVRLSSSTAGVAVDGSGNVYIADKSNNKIRVVSQSGCTCMGKAIAAGNIDTVIGSTSGDVGSGVTAVATRLSSPTGVYFDRTSGQLFINDTNNFTVRKVSINNNVFAIAGSGTSGQNDGVLAAGNGVVNPAGVAVDANGNVFFADKGDNKIREIWANTGEVSVVAGIGLVGGAGDGGYAGQARTSAPEGVAVDTNGVVYIADTGSNKIRAVCPAYGSTCTVLTVSIPAGFIDTVASGSTTAGTCSNGLGAINASCKISAPRGVEVGSNLDLYFADTTNNKIGWVPHATTSSGTYGLGTVTGNAMYGIVTGLSAPQDVAVDSSNNVFFADTGNHRIKEISPGGTAVSTVAGNGTGGHCSDGASATGACTTSPSGVAVDGSTVYVADTTGAWAWKFTVGGTVTTIAGTGTAGFAGDGGGGVGAAVTAVGITKKSGGNVWLAGGTTTNIQVRKILGPI